MDGLWPVPDTLAFLEGNWRVTRTVRDLADGGFGRFEGSALFGPLGDSGLMQRESGTFTWRDDIPRPAERILRFLPGPKNTVDVRFEDGRPFHPLDLSTGRYIASHPCSADLYQGEFTVLDEDHWRTLWRVRGPFKDLALDTGYVRVE